MGSIAFSFCLVLVLTHQSDAHSFLTVPHAISTMDGCRIGGTGGFVGDCPGPCPNYNIAEDSKPTNPSAIFKRGAYHRVVWTRNNHEGGFVSWSLVPIDKMWSSEWHQRMTFHYNCWNVGRFNCNAFDFHRDCNYDLDNEAYSKMLYIPPIYPDGDYVLGWTWYGGGVLSGHFGDYYDCSYVRISGGATLQHSYKPGFAAGGGSMHEDGCEATVNKLGICWKEPCVPIRNTKKHVPAVFENGSYPEPIQAEWYGNGTQAPYTSIRLIGFFLVDAKRDLIVTADASQILFLNRRDEVSLIVFIEGDVEFVEWYTNGKKNGRDYGEPYSIAGDFRNDFYPWMYPLFNRRIRVSVKVGAKNGTFTWGNVELRFQETTGEGFSSFHGVTWDELKSIHTEGGNMIQDKEDGNQTEDIPVVESTGFDAGGLTEQEPNTNSSRSTNQNPSLSPSMGAQSPAVSSPAAASPVSVTSSPVATIVQVGPAPAAGATGESTSMLSSGASVTSATSGSTSASTVAVSTDLGSTFGMSQEGGFVTTSSSASRRSSGGGAGPSGRRVDKLERDDDFRQARAPFL